MASGQTPVDAVTTAVTPTRLALAAMTLRVICVTAKPMSRAVERAVVSGQTPADVARAMAERTALEAHRVLKETGAIALLHICVTVIQTRQLVESLAGFGTPSVAASRPRSLTIHCAILPKVARHHV